MSQIPSIKRYFEEIEWVCINHKLTFPAMTLRILKKIPFTPSNKEVDDLLEKMVEGYGSVIDLNKEYDLKLQYHGKYCSFLIGFGINPINAHQPDFKLLRVDTCVETSHTDKKVAFFGAKKIKEQHVHWYNQFHRLFINNPLANSKATLENYQQIIGKILSLNKDAGFTEDLIKQAVPLEEFYHLHTSVILKKKLLRDDGYITINNKIKEDSAQVLHQILNRELF